MSKWDDIKLLMDTLRKLYEVMMKCFIQSVMLLLCSLLEPGGPCTKSMEISESSSGWVKFTVEAKFFSFNGIRCDKPGERFTKHLVSDFH